ncbi:MAG: hypothetical protein ABIP97_06950, partial [Chthoniobacterales bacterium]
IGKTFEVIFITDENGTAPGYYTILKHEGDGDWYYVMPKPANPAEKIDPTWKPFWINIAQAKYIFPKPDRK